MSSCDRCKIKGICMINLNELKGHECTLEERIKELQGEILRDGILKKPIVVDKATLVILDGHHRVEVLKRLGCKKIPAVLVDYRDPNIMVLPWRKGEKVSKSKVIEAALSKMKLPPKTTMHMVVVGEGLKHIEYIQPRVDLPLNQLKREDVEISLLKASRVKHDG
ncbi:MAG TPA: hypothetical protein EYP68_06510 [Candidatus Korarchaeota archaeon]|nr:hypothetical protein [Candidatus Korarchaeota archaeon]